MGETVTWSGECARKRSVLDGLAHGRGTLKAGDWSFTGEYVDGKRHGRWIGRDSKGNVHEYSYVDGKKHGRWVIRSSSGHVIETPYVNGKKHGRAVTRFPDGTSLVLEWRNGKILGNYKLNYAKNYKSVKS